MYKILIINSFDDFLALKNEWEDLRISNGFSLFSSFDWYRCLLQASKNTINLFVIVIKNEDTGRIEGILPLQKDKRFSINGLTSLVNDDTHCFEFIVEKKHEEQLLSTLYDFLRRLHSVSYVELTPVSEHHAPLMHLTALDENFCLVAEKRSPYLMCSRSFPDLLQGKAKKSRQRMRNHINRFNRLGEVTREKLSRLSPADFDDIIKISEGSWKGGKGSAISSKKTTKTFFWLLCEAAERQEWLQVWFLAINDHRVAMEFHLRERGTVFALRGDYLDLYKQHSPGGFLDYYIIKSYCEDSDIHEYDMCGDLYDYKMKWTTASQQFFRILWIKNPFIRVLYNVKQLTGLRFKSNSDQHKSNDKIVASFRGGITARKAYD